MNTILRAALIALVLTAASCDEDKPEPSLPSFSTPDDTEPPSVPQPPPEFVPPQAVDICNRDAVRCRATGSAEIEVCAIPDGASVDVARWVPDRCEGDEVCFDGACQSFACTPGRAACDSLTSAGMCNEAGDALLDVVDCEGEEVCRGGRCLDLCESAANEKSYIGCNYLLVELPNPLTREGTEDSPFGIVVANPDRLHALTVSVFKGEGELETLIDTTTVRSNGLIEPSPAPVEVRSTVRDEKNNPIDFPSGQAVDIEIPPGGTATLLLPHRMLQFGTSGVFSGTRKLVSSKPVIAYQFSPYCCNFSFTNDASLLLPIEALGTDYYASGGSDWPSSTEDGDRLGMGIAVVAPEDDTEVEVVLPPKARLFPSRTPNRMSFVEETVDRQGAVTATLSAGEVLYLESHSEKGIRSTLTGARVSSDKPLALFSTHACTYIPHSLPACDHLEEQLIPIDTWGSRYVLSPPARRSEVATEVTYWRIVAGDSPTRVQLTTGYDRLSLRSPFAFDITDCRQLRTARNNNTAFQLEAGQDCMLGSQFAIALESSLPVMITGYMSGEVAATNGVTRGTGDPAMFLMPPVSQFRDEYSFLAPETYALDYVTVVIPANAAGAITLDGLPVDPQSEAVTGQTVIGSEYVIMHIPVDDGAHRIEATVPFGILVYAYDQFVSYAYTGGLNLIKRP